MANFCNIGLSSSSASSDNQSQWIGSMSESDLWNSSTDHIINSPWHIPLQASLRHMLEMFGWTGPPISGGRHFVSCKVIPDSTWAWIGFHFAVHCNADQRTTNAATRCVLPAYNAAKCDCNWGSAPHPACYRALPDLLTGFKKAASCGGKGRKEKEGKEKGRKGRKEGWLWCTVGTVPPIG